MEKENDRFEIFVKEWNSYKESCLQQMTLKKKLVRNTMHQRKASLTEKLMFRKLLMFMFCLSVSVYLLANVTIFLAELRFFVPFCFTLGLFVFSTIGYAIIFFKIKKTGDFRKPVVDFATSIDDFLINEKRELHFSFLIALPVLLLSLPQVIGVLFGRKDFYENYEGHLPVLLSGAVISIVAGIMMYRKNRQLIKELKQNVNICKSIEETL